MKVDHYERDLIDAYDLLRQRLVWRCERDLAKAKKLAERYGEEVSRRWLQCQADHIRDQALE